MQPDTDTQTVIIGGVTAGSLAGASHWLLGAACVLAVALVIAHRISSGPRSGAPEPTMTLHH